MASPTGECRDEWVDYMGMGPPGTLHAFACGYKGLPPGPKLLRVPAVREEQVVGKAEFFNTLG
jgi:hypothetical protein